MELKVYSQDKQVKAIFAPSDSSTHQKAIQEDNVLSLSCIHYSCIPLDVNDYVDFLGERFWITEKYVPKQVSSLEWSYECKFYGIESMIKRALVLKTVDGENEVSFSLTAPARDHLELIVENINRVLGTTDWKAGECLATDNLVIEYKGTYCDEGLKKIAEEAKTEWWVDGLTVNISRCEHGQDIPLSYGNGLTKLEKSTANNVKFFTRLFPIGSTRNIDSSVYGHTRLQLPDGQKYVEQNLQYGIIEHSEESAFSGIYPKRIGTVASVRYEEKTDDDGEPFTKYYFTDTGLTFDPNDYEIGGLVKHVSFQDGSELAGRDFEVNFNSKTHEFEIIPQYPYDDGTQLPGGLLVPKPGDKYILWNIRMPDEYYAIAEAEYSAAVASYMEEHKLDKAVYKGTTDYIELAQRETGLSIGQRIRLESWQHFPDVGYRNSRITKITRKLNNPSQAEIDISDVLSKGTMNQIEDSIEAVRNYTQTATSAFPDIVRSWENTPASDYNLFSSKKSEREFVNKRKKDVAQKLIGFLEGIYTGDFVSGLSGGSGARIDEKGYAEMTGLVLREFLEVPELRFNRVDVISGELWNSAVFGIIESVDVENQIAKIKLEEGELNGLHVNDFLRGIFHNIEGGNVTTEDIDGCGFPILPGFTTVYFTPVELLPDGKSIRYALKPGTTAHPCKAMKFAGYGHPTDKTRQSSAYSTRTYKRYLKDVSTWEIDPGKHVAMQFGDCSGLIINGKDMSGYSAYLNNIYITGVIEWLEDHKDDFKGEDGKDAYSVALSSYDAVIAVNSEGKIDSSLYDVINIVSGTEMAYAGDHQITATKYKIQTTIQAYCGEKVLQQSDVVGTGKYLVEIVPKGCEFTVADGVVTITKVMVDKATLDITVNCEGMAVFTKTFTLTRVYGEKGFAGNDGKDIEFIFLRSKAPEADIPLSENTDGFIPEGWTDNPVGVTSVYVYELISRRIKINGIWGAFSTPAPWSRYANDGVSPYFLNLTNDSATVAADKNGHITDYSLAATTAQLFVGQEVCECTFEVDRITEGATFVQDGANFQVTGIPDNIDNVQLIIAAKVGENIVGSVSFNVSKARTGADGKDVTIHYLQLSASIVKRGNDGIVDVSFIDVVAMQKTGNLDPVESTNTTIRYKRSDDEDWVTGNKVTITNNTIFIDIELLSNSGTLLDSERIPVVSDGNNGDDGKDGVGFEIIFIRQKTDRVPDTPLSKNQDGYVPDGWTNDQQGTSVTWPYEFSSRRRKVGGIWGAFSTPVIWSRYSYDGDDAYSVALSSYEDVITLNSKGEIDSSLYDIINIVAGNELVYAGDSQVVTKKYKIQTSVYAFHGAIKLEYADVATTGKYSVTITAYGCQYSVIAGVITITRITQDKASLDIVVNCEGKITVTKTYTVTRVWNGLDANLLPWIEDWDSNKNKFGDDYVISPKIFSGEKNPTTAALTGVALGRGVVTVDGVKKTGLFGIKNGKLTFELDAETGDATFRGTVYADAGKLGGIKIDGDSLTNDGFDNDAYIILRNDRTKAFAGMGGNLLPATSGGISAVARFENNRIVKGDAYSPSNIAMYLEASGSDGDNIALMVTKGRMDVPGLLMGGRVAIVNNAITMPYQYGPWRNYRISRPNDLGFIIEHNLGHSRYYVTATLCDVGSRNDMGLTGLIDVFEIRDNYFRVLVCTRDGTSVAKGFSFSIIGDNR